MQQKENKHADTARIQREHLKGTQPAKPWQWPLHFLLVDETVKDQSLSTQSLLGKNKCYAQENSGKSPEKFLPPSLKSKQALWCKGVLSFILTTAQSNTCPKPGHGHRSVSQRNFYQGAESRWPCSNMALIPEEFWHVESAPSKRAGIQVLAKAKASDSAQPSSDTGGHLSFTGC